MSTHKKRHLVNENTGGRQNKLESGRDNKEAFLIVLGDLEAMMETHLKDLKKSYLLLLFPLQILS